MPLDPRRVVADLYHHLFTGLLLALVTRYGADVAAEFVFCFFRRKQEEQFLPGLAKLGLHELPDAVACAQYHYLSNAAGGVGVEYVYESDRKAWVRYPPPRWIWEGVAIAAIPSQVSAAMLRGWHAHNGVSLGNPRLGYVCTGQTVDGQPGLEGYFFEGDRDLGPEERLQFRPLEHAPRFDQAKAPALESAAWPEERRAKAYRNYAMDYLRTALPLLVELLGAEEARRLGSTCARVVGLQFYAECASNVGGAAPGAAGFARLFETLAVAQGDRVEVTGDGERAVVEQTTWQLARGAAMPPVAFEIWNELWAGMLGAHDRFLEWRVEEPVEDRLGLPAGAFRWTIAS